MAALLALLVDVVGNRMGSYETYFLVLCTFLGGAIPTVFKFRRPFSDRWNYAVVMAMITFHLLILTQSDEKIKLPLVRLVLIAIGFVIASLVNVILLPNFAGTNINDLLATNFVRAANVIERCVLEYCQGTVLQQHPEAHNHAAHDELHRCFHELMAADSEVDKLVRPVTFHFWKYLLNSFSPKLKIVLVFKYKLLKMSPFVSLSWTVDRSKVRASAWEILRGIPMASLPGSDRESAVCLL